MTEPSQLPRNWKEVLRGCNFFLARREISYFFECVKSEGKAKGGEYVFPTESVNRWKEFANRPCYDTAVGLAEHWPTLFMYFEGSCPGGQFYRPGIKTAKTFELGHYKLGTHTKDMVGLRELSREEYAFFRPRLKGEVIYHAPPTQFLGHLWNMKVGVIDGRVWKLAASLEIDEQEEMVKLMESAYFHCEAPFGTPTEEEQGLQIWDTSDGNVILQVASMADSYAVNLFVTDGNVVRSAGRTWKTIFGLG